MKVLAWIVLIVVALIFTGCMVALYHIDQHAFGILLGGIVGLGCVAGGIWAYYEITD